MAMENQAQRNCIHPQEMQTLAVKARVLFLNLEQFSLLVQDLVKVHQAIRRCITTSDQELDRVEQTLAILLLDYILHLEPLLLLVNHRNLRLKFALLQEMHLLQAVDQLVEMQQAYTRLQEALRHLLSENLPQLVSTYPLEVQAQKETVLLEMEPPGYTHHQGKRVLEVADLRTQANFAPFLFLLLFLQMDLSQQADFIPRQELLLQMDLLAKLRTGCTRCRGHQATPQMVHQVHRRFERFKEVEQIKRTENLLLIV
jgi:hypothetical protein